MSVALIILAAGKGTRMKSDLPKVLHPIAGAPMLHHALRAVSVLEPAHTIVVAGHGSDQVHASALDFDPSVQVVLQEEQLGTGHAVDQSREVLEGFDGDVVVVFGDTPFLQPDTLTRMVEARRSHDVVVLGFDIAEIQPRYGRLVMDGDRLIKIVEYKDATEDERAIRFTNSGLMACDAKVLFELLSEVTNDNASGEYYLTAVPELANTRGLKVTAVKCDEAETLGVDSRSDLAEADAIFQKRARAELLDSGVTMMAPDTVYLSFDTVVGRDALIEPNVVFGPDVTVESGATIRAFSHLEGCHVSRSAIVGPYARLRPGAELAEDVRIGNFVEVKNATLAARGKGQSSVLYRRRIGGRGQQYWCRHHHLQLRWCHETPDRDRRACIHRIQYDACGACDCRSRGDDRIGFCHHIRRGRWRTRHCTRAAGGKTGHGPQTL